MMVVATILAEYFVSFGPLRDDGGGGGNGGEVLVLLASFD